MRRLSSTLLLGLSLLTSSPLIAAEQDLDSVLEGFDEPAESTDNGDTSLDEVLGGFEEGDTETDSGGIIVDRKPWQLGGAFTLASAYNYAHNTPAANETDYRGLSRLRGKLNLELDAELSESWDARLAGYAWYDGAYAINGRDDYTDEVLEEYESEIELSEAWLRGRLNNRTDLKLGRQIVVWGKSDNIRITDVINPLDNREPGMVDIEDLRLPLGMARLDYYVGDWGVTAMAIPEIRFNKNPPFGSEFYPYTTPMPDEVIPEDGGDNTEYALAANGIFSGWDLSLYWARLYDDNPHLVRTSSGPRLEHNRLTMTGFATNVAIENWLLKAEAAHFNGLEFDSLPNESLARVDSLLGVEYSGFSETTLTLEVANRHYLDYGEALLNEGIEEDEWQTALRYQGDFMHARLHLLALVSAFGDRLDEGGFGRYSAAYDLADALTVTGGIVNYESGDKAPFNAIGDSDRVFVDLKYSF
ncbi:MAG: DUF1302 family protein [Pseudomonadota bacterium]